MSLPILYSFRRCPYAMRARLALMHCGVQCELREVVLKDKPAHMLRVSKKGTVPVLLLPTEHTTSNFSDESHTVDGFQVIEESIDIMHWAMSEYSALPPTKSDPWKLTDRLSLEEIRQLIEENDGPFKEQLDKFKYSDRHPEHSQDYYLQQAMPFLQKLDKLLKHSVHLTGDHFGFTDAAILPFIRQFSMVNPRTFNTLPLPNLQQWLQAGITSELFISIMDKYSAWKVDSSDKPIVFGRYENA